MSVSRALAVLLAVVLVAAACSRSGEPEEPAVPEPPSEDATGTDDEDEPENTRTLSPLTGERVDEQVLERPMLIVKIDNHPQARPQSGLDAADVVYEEVVEGGITRFLSLLHSELPDTTGPIRSARPVDTQLMSGYGDSGFAYSGARDEVQTMLANTPSVRVTEGGPGFFRDGSRRAPHDLYVRTPETVAGVLERGAGPLDDVGWSFSDDVPEGAVTCPPGADDCADPGRRIDVRMSTSYTTGWEYDETEGVYRRFQNGEPFLVTGEGRVGAANVVVLATRHYIGASGYPETDVTTDDGAAAVLRDGRLYQARWDKPTAGDPLRILTLAGDPFPLKPGATWLHLGDTASLPAFGD